MPFVDRGIELHSRIATDPCAFGDFAQQRARVLLLAWLAVGYATRPPFMSLLRRFHEFVADPHAYVFVLIHHRSVRVAVVTAVITLLDECPGFFLFLLLRIDELFDVGVPILDRIHLRGAPC